MVNVANRFGDWIKEGFDLFKNNAGVLILASLIALLLTGVTLGILGGPMFAGMISIVLRLKDGSQPQPQATDVFEGFKNFMPCFLFGIVWGLGVFIVTAIAMLIPCVGVLLGPLVSIVATTFLMFGLFLIVDKKMDFWPASIASYEKVKLSFFPFLGLAFVAGTIGNIGSLLCGIGAFVTLPLYFTIIAAAYREVFAGDMASAQPPVQPAPQAPPEFETLGDAQTPPAPEAPEEGKE